MTTVAPAPAVSIVIAVLDQLDYTRQCLTSIREHSDLPYEIIIIDNGSCDGSAAHCAEAGCRVIRNDENLGCARAWNQGIRAAGHPLIVIMNNDVVVTQGWLSGLVEFQRRMDTAITSPAVINGARDYDLPIFAANYRRRFGTRWRAGWRGECFLVPRAVFDQVGLFDDRFRGGGFEDDDLDLRVRQAGLRTAITGAALIHHFHQVTQRALAGATWKELKNPNKTLLEKKWGWRLRARRVRKELAKLGWRLHYPGFHGRNPRDLLVVGEDERLDLEQGVKRRRPPPSAR